MTENEQIKDNWTNPTYLKFKSNRYYFNMSNFHFLLKKLTFPGAFDKSAVLAPVSYTKIIRINIHELTVSLKQVNQKDLLTTQQGSVV